jgi:hypothetical protein
LATAGAGAGRVSFASTALTLYLPLLSRDFFESRADRKDVTTLVRVVGLFALISIVSFALNVVSGPALHARLGGHPVRHAPGDVPPPAPAVAALLRAHAAGDIMSRINNDIGEIQRIAGRDRARLVRQRAVPRRHDRHADLARLAAVPGQRRDRADRGLGAGAVSRAGSRIGFACCASAAPTSAAS